MRPARTLLHTLFAVVAVTGCAAERPATRAPEAQACARLDALRPDQIAAVEPLWVPNPAVKSPAYTLGGVIIALHAVDAATCDRLQQPGCPGTLTSDRGRPLLVLRADDPTEARALLRRAEALQAAR